MRRIIDYFVIRFGWNVHFVIIIIYYSKFTSNSYSKYPNYMLGRSLGRYFMIGCLLWRQHQLDVILLAGAFANENICEDKESNKEMVRHDQLYDYDDMCWSSLIYGCPLVVFVEVDYTANTGHGKLRLHLFNKIR